MNENEKMLTKIRKVTHMGQTGIRCVEDLTHQPALRQALSQQRLEYARLEKSAVELAKSGGMTIKKANPMLDKMAAMSSRMQLMVGDTDSKISGMMIQGNTRGMIQTLKSIHRVNAPDPKVAELSQELLETQINNIRQMKGFL